jgi:two-component sensor histidine kinase
MHPDERLIQIQLYDVFSTRLFGGNVAGVVYADEWLGDDADAGKRQREIVLRLLRSQTDTLCPFQIGGPACPLMKRTGDYDTKPNRPKICLQVCRSEAFHEWRREYNVEYRIVRPGGEIRWVETRCFIAYNGVGYPKRVVGVSIDVTERKRVQEQQRALLAELDHRVKNTLATVSAIVGQTRDGSGSMVDFVTALEGRIRAMATTHELLSACRWQGVSLTELVRRELAPYAAGSNSAFKGPDVHLRPEAAQAMSMVLHELTTNAAKYGALSNKDGRVSVRWERRVNGQTRPLLVLDWQEIGGPPVVAPGNSSYGTSTIREVIPYEFGGTVNFELAREGVRCRLELPADWLSNNGPDLGTPPASAA